MCNQKKIDILVFTFLGTGGKVTNDHGTDIKINNKIYTNIKLKIKIINNKITATYTFQGPNLIDTGKTRIRKNVENAVKIFKELTKNEQLDDDIKIKITGHSRGGIAATLTYDKLRKKFHTHSSKISLMVSDPYSGPLGIGKKTSIDLNRRNKTLRSKIKWGKTGKTGDEQPKKEQSTNNLDNNTVVFYSMGTSFKCTPQKILNAKTIFICEAGHNASSTYANLYDDIKKLHPNLNIESGGVFLLTGLKFIKNEENGKLLYHTNNIICERITKDNLNYCITKICEWEKSFHRRTRVLRDVIAKKLDLTETEIANLPSIGTWKKEFIREYRKSKELKNRKAVEKKETTVDKEETSEKTKFKVTEVINKDQNKSFRIGDHRNKKNNK